jgi:hypothetical protein
MTPATNPTIQLLVSPRANRPTFLYPEQTADFDIVLLNAGGTAAKVKALEGNLDTPLIRMFGTRGIIGEFDKRAMGARMAGDAATLVQPSPQMVTLAPGARNATWANLWSFHDALPPGSYSVDVVHELDEAGSSVTSDRLKFEIVPVRVADAALGYDSRNRSQTLLAWLSGMERATKLRLLVRESGFAGHGSLHQGGTMLGEYDPGSRVAVSHLPWDARIAPVGWVAVFPKDGRVDVIRHASTFPQGSAAHVNLGLRNAMPVPRFPNRGHAVVLATGLSANGSPELAGALVALDGGKAAWHVPLKAMPKLTTCAFMQTGGIQLLLVSDDGKQSVVRKIEVDENGKVLSPEQTIRTTNNEIVAVAVGQRSPQAFFLMLESDRKQHGQMTLWKTPASGQPNLTMTDLGSVRGWPARQATEGPQMQPARTLTLEQAPDGSAWIAMTDPKGDLYCGQVDGTLTLLREAKGSELLFPHVAALRTGVACFGFESNGSMFIPAGSRGHSH